MSDDDTYCLEVFAPIVDIDSEISLPCCFSYDYDYG